jgi:hypothetical protein
MLFVGLDLSMRATGAVILNADGEVLDKQCLGFTAAQRPCKTVHQRIAYYASMANIIRELLRTARKLHDLDPNDYDQMAIAVEDYASHSPGDPTIGPEMGGIVRLALVGYSRLHEISVTSIKKFATNNGNSKKPAMMLDVYRRWGFDCGGNDNINDAYVLARMVRAAYLGDGSLSTFQVEALAKAGLGGLR